MSDRPFTMSTPTIEPTQPGAVIDPDTDHLHFEMAETAPIASRWVTSTELPCRKDVLTVVTMNIQ